MSKKVVAILSVLKPVDDTRNYEKIATTLGNTNKYDINIIGFSTKNLPTATNITFYPAFSFNRLSISRLVAPFLILKLLLKLKPELLIVTCSEILLVSIIYKILFGSKIIYDIQENYYRNILYTNTYPALFRLLLAVSVRLLEWTSYPFINYYLLAEKIYWNQLRFVRSKAMILENKAVIPNNLNNIQIDKKSTTTFLYSGTIAEHYGIFDAISFIQKLHSINQKIQFRIVGFAPDSKVMENVRRQTNDLHYIQIFGGDELVPHNQILKEIANADFSLMPYKKNKSTEGRIPTKLYECLALEMPIIITPNPAWNDLIENNKAGFLFDFQSDSIDAAFMDSITFYGSKNSMNYQWISEEKKLTNLIDQII